MRQEIELPSDARTFTRSNWNSLDRTGKYLPSGTVVTVSDQVQVEYDHQRKGAVEILHPKSEQPLFLLLEEIGNPDLVA